ncbi:LuxR family transcriptional regulator [Pseudaestuariivita atlantica]|uniref:LuxR family transcriptional regulator n=1 Tax=Pseudaestuariivita atlantica TaxID=1317121 RepID=A0A0L1JMH4_9RHOB|nr:LuxR family transcriptional regulator [Pseudaestuariivita atlantica]KNG92945.1 LuxR family transcriptional regulator [Pseudaestuariivita atlantica]
MKTNLRQYLIDITNAPSIEEMWELHVRVMGEYGFDRLLYGFTNFRTEHSLGDPNDFLLLTNHNPEYMDGFIKQGFFSDAPMVKWALENDGAQSWRWMAEVAASGAVSPKMAKVIEFNRDMQVIAGYTISFKSVSPRSKGAIALTAKPGISQDDVDAIWAESGTDLIVMNNVAHLKILNLPFHVSGRTLTKRQLEALQWVGDGKTMQDIATIMGLTQATVEKHLRLARDALDVETTAQAVLKAAFQNQMYLVDR